MSQAGLQHGQGVASMAKGMRAGIGEGHAVGSAAPRACSMATPGGSRRRSGGCSPTQDAQHWRGASRTPGPSSAHPGDAGSPPAMGQDHLSLPNAARERGRVRALRRAFLSLQAALPTVPPGTKLSKLDVLVLATSYIAHLRHTLGHGPPPPSPPPRGHPLLHPLKKWPMRCRLYARPWAGPTPDPTVATEATSSLGHKELPAGDGPP